LKESQSLSNNTVRALTASDQQVLEDFLAPKLAYSLFLIGNSRRAGFVDKGNRYQGTYVGAFDGSEMQAVVAHYWNGMLVLQAPRFLSQIAAEALRLSGRELKGLIGPDEQVQAAKILLNLQDSDYQLDEEDGLYTLQLKHLVIPDQLLNGQVAGRRVAAQDLEQVTAWRVAYSVEVLGVLEDQQRWERSRLNMMENISSGQSWVLERGEKLVATTSFNTSVSEAVQVGGVYTPPEYRGKGYGRAVVAASLIDARDDGAELVVLFTGDDNTPARKAYAALGFGRIGDFRLSFLSKPVGNDTQQTTHD
jgi:predicted GNAT family acetyltransferase